MAEEKNNSTRNQKPWVLVLSILVEVQNATTITSEKQKMEKRARCLFHVVQYTEHIRTNNKYEERKEIGKKGEKMGMKFMAYV